MVLLNLARRQHVSQRPGQPVVQAGQRQAEVGLPGIFRLQTLEDRDRPSATVPRRAGLPERGLVLE